MTETITIPGPPIAKARPRFVRRGKYVGTYSVQTTEEGKFMLLARSCLRHGPAPKGAPVKITCRFTMPIPASLSAKKRAALEGRPHVKKPDLDNLIKFIKDCLRGLAWYDDSQVTEIVAEKVYGDKPETTIIIEY